MAELKTKDDIKLSCPDTVLATTFKSISAGDILSVLKNEQKLFGEKGATLYKQLVDTLIKFSCKEIEPTPDQSEALAMLARLGENAKDYRKNTANKIYAMGSVAHAESIRDINDNAIRRSVAEVIKAVSEVKVGMPEAEEVQLTTDQAKKVVYENVDQQTANLAERLAQVYIEQNAKFVRGRY